MDMVYIYELYGLCLMVVTVLLSCDMITRYSLYYNSTLVYTHGEWWRLCTCFMRGIWGLSMYDMYISYMTLVFLKKLRDLALGWILLVCAPLILSLGIPSGYIFYDSSICGCIVYIWCHRHRFDILRLGTVCRVRVRFLLLIMLFVEYTIKEDVGQMIIGYLIGHLYVWFFKIR